MNTTERAEPPIISPLFLYKYNIAFINRISLLATGGGMETAFAYKKILI